MLPGAPYRQGTLSFPRPCLARDARLYDPVGHRFVLAVALYDKILIARVSH